jgi:hypothetical protein
MFCEPSGKISKWEQVADRNRYGNCEISKHRLQELTSNTVENLRRWKENLPPELKIYDTADFLQPLPHILALQ